MKEHAGASRDAGEQRREQMLRAALEVIVERGYADTRIADVAERTGTSRRWSSTTSRRATSC